MAGSGTRSEGSQVRERVPSVGTRESTHKHKRNASVITSVAWKAGSEIDLAEWIAAGRKLGTLSRCNKWWLGDWIRYGNARFGERYARAAAITGYDVQSLMNMVWVASRFEISRRREILSWSHHETVASLEHDVQEQWLDRATEEKLSVADLRLELRTARKLVKEGAQSEGDPSLSAAPVVVCPNCGQEVLLAEGQTSVISGE
jgi:hypothetical protein